MGNGLRMDSDSYPVNYIKKIKNKMYF